MKISVCLATYNGEKYIMEQIKSILNQTLKVDEIIISDNGSTDKTINLIKGLKNKRIKIITLKKRKRVALNFENALKLSKGNIIFLSDQDDIWKENKVEICVKNLKGFDLLIHNATLVNENLENLDINYFEKNGIRKGKLNNILKSSFLGCCMVFQSSILKKSLPFPKFMDTENKPYNHCHDTWIGLNSKKIKYLNINLIQYRRHAETVSESGGKSKNSLKIKILFRLTILKELLKGK